MCVCVCQAAFASPAAQLNGPEEGRSIFSAGLPCSQVPPKQPVGGGAKERISYRCSSLGWQAPSAAICPTPGKQTEVRSHGLSCPPPCERRRCKTPLLMAAFLTGNSAGCKGPTTRPTKMPATFSAPPSPRSLPLKFPACPFFSQAHGNGCKVSTHTPHLIFPSAGGELGGWGGCHEGIGRRAQCPSQGKKTPNLRKSSDISHVSPTPRF